MKKLRRQRAVQGGRRQRGAGLERRVDDALMAMSRRLGVSVPFITTTALADFLHIDLDVEDRCDGRPTHMKLVRQQQKAG